MSNCQALSAASSQWSFLSAETRTPRKVIVLRWNWLLKDAILLQDKPLGMRKQLPTIISFNLVLPVTTGRYRHAKASVRKCTLVQSRSHELFLTQ